MKRKLIGLMLVMLLVMPMNGVFADTDAQTIVNDVEIMIGEVEVELDFNAEDNSYDIVVPYNTLSLEFKAKTDLTDLENVFVTVNGDVNDVLVLNDELVLIVEDADDELKMSDIDLTLDAVDVKAKETQVAVMTITENYEDGNDENDVVTTYTFNISKTYLVEVLDVYAEGLKVDLMPDFESQILTYQTVVAYDEDITIVAELADPLLEGVYSLYTKGNKYESLDDELIFDMEVVNDDEDVDTYDLPYGGNSVWINVYDTETNASKDDRIERYLVDVYVANVDSIMIMDGNDKVPFKDKDGVGFDGTVLEYTASVGYDVESVDFIVDLFKSSDATFKVNGEDGDDLNNVRLDYGINVVTVTVSESSDLVYTFTIARENPLLALDFYVEDEVKMLKLDPAFDSSVYIYDLMVPIDKEEVTVEFKLAEGSLAEVYFGTNLGDTIYTIESDDDDVFSIDVEPGTETLVFTVVDGDESKVYVVEMMQAAPLILEIEELEAFDFSSSKFEYMIRVENEVDLLTFLPEVDEVVSLYFNGDLLEDDEVEVNLVEYKTKVVFTTELLGVTQDYTFVIYRDNLVEKPEEKPNSYEYEYEYGEAFNFSHYSKIVNAFKWGNNKENVIVFEMNEDDVIEFKIPYPVYKFMVQRNVKFEFVFDFENTQLIPLKNIELNRHIKGPNDVDYIILEFDFDVDPYDVDVDFELNQFSRWNKSFKDSKDFDDEDVDDEDVDEDDEDDDDDKKEKSNNGRWSN